MKAAQCADCCRPYEQGTQPPSKKYSLNKKIFSDADKWELSPLNGSPKYPHQLPSAIPTRDS